MALSLVSYDDSGESGNESDDSNAPTETSTSDKKNTIVISNTIRFGSQYIKTKELSSDNNLSNFSNEEELEPTIERENTVDFSLPESNLHTLNTDIDIKCLTSTNKRNGPVKIMIPSLNKVEEDFELPAKKKLKPSQKGSGLFALLPSPKSSLVPHSVVNKKHNITSNASNTGPNKIKPLSKVRPVSVANKSALINYEDSGDEDEVSGTVDFFSLDSKEEPTNTIEEIMNLPESQPVAQNVSGTDNRYDTLNSNVNIHVPSWSETLHSQPSSSVHQNSNSVHSTTEFVTISNTDLDLNEEAMQQLCGRRDRLKKQELKIIDVNGDAIMPDSRDWLTKQLTEEQTHRTSHKKKDGPTSQQKRKHQITYLAFQAKENELELKNQWANNRMSRKQTQAKYGF